MVGFWGQITTLKLIHICCRSIQGHNIIRCKAFSNTIHNFCVGNITKSEINCPRRWQWYKCVFTQDVTTLLYANLPNRCIFFIYWTKIQYFILTKQSCYYLIFFMKVFTFVSMLAYTSGFKCQRPNIFSLAFARPKREIVHQYVIYRNEDLRPLIWVGTAYREDGSIWN
jgi:hypothetical protein